MRIKINVQKSEVRSRKSEDRCKSKEISGCRRTVILFSVFCFLSSVFCSQAYSFLWFGGCEKPKAPAQISEPAKQAPLTLEEAYRLALEQSEDVAMKQQELERAQGHLYQALNEVTPEVNFLMTEQIQDAPKKGSSSGGGDSSNTGNLTRRTTPQKRFTLHQPIFSGFKEIAGVEGSNAEKAQKEYEKRRLEDTLLTDLVSAFYAVVQAEKDITTFEETKKTLEDRIGELKSRVNVGRSRESEIQTALSDEKKVEADLVVAKSDAVIARQQLEYYIGRSINGDLADPDDSFEIKDQDYYLDKVDSRPDVKAANEAYILAEKAVVVAQSGLFPSAYLDGDYYTQRVGIQSGIDWDVLLSVNVPIFNGTETIGDIKVAASEREMAKYNFLKTKRLARLDIRNAYEEYNSAKLEEAALKEAADAKKKDYDLQEAEYKHNLVNNLDVLTALKDYQDLSRQLNEAHYTTKNKYWQLKVAVGETMDKKIKEAR